MGFRLAAASLIALMAATGTTIAADPLQDPPVVATDVFNWSGFYAGANVGADWTSGNATSDVGPLFPPFAVLPPVTPVFTVIPGQLDSLGGGNRSVGIIGGGQVGYNWQINKAVLGVEADFLATNLDGATGTATRTFGPPIIPVPVTQTVTVGFGGIDWMGSFRGRAGFARNKALFYLTAGGAVAQIGGTTTTVVNSDGIGLPAGTSVATTGGTATVWGWTVGGGIEWAFNENWSFGGEYRYTDFGSRGRNFDIPSGLPAAPIFATGTGVSRLAVGQVTLRVNYHPS